MVAPERVDSMWSPSAAEGDPEELLAAALAAGRAAEALDELRPAFAGYAALRGALAQYRAAAERGGWPVVLPGATLGPGSAGTAVAALRARLRASGDLPDDDQATNSAFDADLADAVRRFQRRHGLPADGLVGAATLAALNTPVEARIRQIELNLERWRWLPVTSGGRYLLVNSAAATLTAMDSERPAREHRVIVGRPDRPTPIVSGAVTSIVLNPSWYVPRSIVRDEIAPVMAADTGYAERGGFRVYRDSGGELRRIAVPDVDWAAVEAGLLDYVVVQGPGPANPLGRLKLVFANRFQVYLHDTPNRGLFRSEDRALSHGCVRVEGIEDLAEWLLRGDPAWDHDSLARAVEAGGEVVVTLPQPTPVYVGYWTAWVDDDGSVHHSPDHYGWDDKLAAALSGAHAAFMPGSSSHKTCGAIVDRGSAPQ
jgi:murein L,D-transpeptidase YcbB/YkuD